MPPQEPEPGLAGAYRYAWLGMQFAAAILMFMGIGYLLDRLLRTLPAFLIGGTIVGAVLGFMSIYRRVIGGDGAKGATDKAGGGRRKAEGGRRTGPT